MRKKIAAVLLCILLTVSLAVPIAGAEDEVYFVAAGSNVLPLTDATMPFWNGGYLYVSSTIFTGLAWDALDVGHIAANSRQPLILYSGGDKSLMFTPGESYAKDLTGTNYYPGAVERNGNVFVPVALVAKYFGLEYSLIRDVEHGYLVWLRKPGFGLRDRDFANAAIYSMTQRYAEYQKNKQSGGSQSGNILVNPNDPTDKRNIYLCMKADSTAGTILDALDRQNAQAAFFCTQEFLETQGDMLRRMVAMGHAVGILADAENEELTVEEQLAAGNEALYRATCTKTRFALVENSEQSDFDAATEAGYCCFFPELDRSGYDLRSSANADSLLQRIAARRDDTTVWLGDAVNANGLRAFLTAVESGARCLALTETA